MVVIAANESYVYFIIVTLNHVDFVVCSIILVSAPHEHVFNATTFKLRWVVTRDTVLDESKDMIAHRFSLFSCSA